MQSGSNSTTVEKDVGDFLYEWIDAYEMIHDMITTPYTTQEIQDAAREAGYHCIALPMDPNSHRVADLNLYFEGIDWLDSIGEFKRSKRIHDLMFFNDFNIAVEFKLKYT